MRYVLLHLINKRQTGVCINELFQKAILYSLCLRTPLNSAMKTQLAIWFLRYERLILSFDKSKWIVLKVSALRAIVYYSDHRHILYVPIPYLAWKDNQKWYRRIVKYLLFA